MMQVLNTRMPNIVAPVVRARNLRVRNAVDSNTTATETPASSSSSTVFYGGQAYTEAEWKRAVADGTVGSASPTPSGAFTAANVPQLSELMAFNGAPEVINGRLSMLGFVAALGAELATGETVLQQVAQEPTLVFLTFVLISAASLIPLMSGSASDEKFGPFQPAAEKLNGRAAMIGFASLLVLEAVRGQALF